MPTDLFATIAETALVASGSYFMALTIPLFIVAIYFLQHVYLKTSRQLRILDLETRSPVYTHFLETLEGLTTIRAFAAQEKFVEENARRLDQSQKPYYLMFCIQRWLALMLDLLLMVMATCVVALATTLRYSTSPGLLGVSLNSVLSFNQTLSAFIAGWTMLETSLGAIARLKNFEAETPKEEKAGENATPPAFWPTGGSIEFKNVSASYDSKSPVLRNINFKILPGQRFGICGRTGSGKSTLLSTLLRILDHSDGLIAIDSVDITTIPRPTLRRRLINVPQDTLHLPGSIRLNADPLGISTDTAIITAMEKVSLWTILAARGGLNADLQVDALSKGQQQLFALARAMLQRQVQGTKVLLMDEATSSMDAESERTIRRVMKEEFQGCTVLCIAHHLETILDMDVVLVMDGGKAVEIGPPKELMAREGGALRRIWRQ
jgi:ABC-type multidrug transport system fused ATPase/permease subunit